MPELCTPALHSLLPDVLSSLSKVFDLVECEMASCPNVSEAPHNLPVSSLGQQIYVIPEKVKIIDANTYLDGAKLVATTEGYHIISDGKPNYTLRIGLQDSSGDWRNCIIDCMTQKYGDKWEFLCLEQISEKSSLHLLRLGKDYVIKEHRSVINGSYYSVRENCTIWLIPVTKVVNEEQNGVVKNGEVNGVEETKPKTIIKKKIIKKVVKKKDPNAEPPKENGTTSLTENGEDKPKKTLVSTKTEKTETGTKVVKKKIVDKSTPKENSPEVVQEVVEDISNAAYIVKLGLIPAPDGKSLADEKNEEIKQNGAFEKDSSEERKCILDTARKFDNIVHNGIPSPKELETNGVDSIILNGKPKESTKPTEFSYGRVSATRPLANGGSLNLVNGQNGDNGNEQGDENPRDRTSFRANRTESTDKSEVSTLSEATSTLSQESKYESPLSPTIRLDPLSSDDEISYSSARSGRTSSSTIKNDTDYEPQRTGVLSGFLSSITSGLGFRRSPSPTTSSGMHETSSRLRNGMLPPISESGSRNSISGHVNGLHRINDKFDRGFSASPLTLSRSQSNTRAGSIGSRFTPPKDEPRVQGMPQMPVIVLQQVLKQFSYKELNQIRRVHPHWDEICGQLLNTGYYELIDRASIMMMDCQRRVHLDKRLERPLKVLTNLQVHVLNPVDILRAPMDEGVICFPYGKILDQSFALLETIEKIIKGMPGFEDPNMIDLPWEPLADWARRAQVHYRRYVEPEVDKRLNEAQKLSAVQRQLQRLDSFLVETNVTRLEKITDKTRDELHWEIEQLKSQNQQLKKDNRELKQNQQKLDARVDALERKFKTVARLLQ